MKAGKYLDVGTLAIMAATFALFAGGGPGKGLDGRTGGDQGDAEGAGRETAAAIGAFHGWFGNDKRGMEGLSPSIPRSAKRLLAYSSSSSWVLKAAAALTTSSAILPVIGA